MENTEKTVNTENTENSDQVTVIPKWKVFAPFIASAAVLLLIIAVVFPMIARNPDEDSEESADVYDLQTSAAVESTRPPQSDSPRNTPRVTGTEAAAPSTSGVEGVEEIPSDLSNPTTLITAAPVQTTAATRVSVTASAPQEDTTASEVSKGEAESPTIPIIEFLTNYVRIEVDENAGEIRYYTTMLTVDSIGFDCRIIGGKSNHIYNPTLHADLRRTNQVLYNAVYNKQFGLMNFAMIVISGMPPLPADTLFMFQEFEGPANEIRFQERVSTHENCDCCVGVPRSRTEHNMKVEQFLNSIDLSTYEEFINERKFVIPPLGDLNWEYITDYKTGEIIMMRYDAGIVEFSVHRTRREAREFASTMMRDGDDNRMFFKDNVTVYLEFNDLKVREFLNQFFG
jgi:hypothetical protein